MRTIATFLIVLTCNFIYAQDKLRYGIQSSFELRGIVQRFYENSNSLVPSFAVGVFLEKKIFKHLHFTVEPSFAFIGSDFNKNVGNVFIEDEYYRFSVIQIPLSLNIIAISKFQMNFGVAPVYILSGNRVKNIQNIGSKIKPFITETKEYSNLNQEVGSSRIQFPVFFGFGFKIYKNLDINLKVYVATDTYTYTELGRNEYDEGIRKYQEFLRQNAGNPLFDPAPPFEGKFVKSYQNSGFSFGLRYVIGEK
jgi:hypothetical protein